MSAVRMQCLLSLITLEFWSPLYECKLYCLFSYNVLDHSPHLGSGLRRHRRSHQDRLRMPGLERSTGSLPDLRTRQHVPLRQQQQDGGQQLLPHLQWWLFNPLVFWNIWQRWQLGLLWRVEVQGGARSAPDLRQILYRCRGIVCLILNCLSL